MSWTNYLPDIMKPVNKAFDIIDQAVDDGDLNQKLKAMFYLTELNTKTLPLIDGLHKLGRQLLAWGQVGFYAWASAQGVEITWELVAGVSGATGAYTLAKGKGK